MSIKAQSYLYPTADGVWMFQIFIPVYMRHIFGGKRMYRKSTGTIDLTAAKHFRNHMLLKWKTLKEQYSPDTEEQRIQHAIAGLHKQATLRAPLQTVPTLTAIRDQYADKYRDKRSFSTLARSARAAEVFLASLDRVDVKITEIRRSQVTMFINQQGKKAPQTVQNWLTCLGSLYEYARRSHDDITPDNPFHGMNLEARATIESYRLLSLTRCKSYWMQQSQRSGTLSLWDCFQNAALMNWQASRNRRSRRWKVYAVSSFRSLRPKRGSGMSRFTPGYLRLSMSI